MAQVTLMIGDREHKVACRDGSEDDLRRMGAMLDARWADANRASGGHNHERTMLLIALMLADALDETERRPAALDKARLAALADRLESLAAALEHRAGNP